MQQYHIIVENPAGSGTFTETGEVHEGSADDAATRCVSLSLGDGGRYGFWVLETVKASNLGLTPGAPFVKPEDVQLDAIGQYSTGTGQAMEEVKPGADGTATIEGDQPAAVAIPPEHPEPPAV